MKTDPSGCAIHFLSEERHVTHAEPKKGESEEPPTQSIQPAMMNESHGQRPDGSTDETHGLVLNLGILLSALFHQVIARAREHYDSHGRQKAHGEDEDVGSD